jgi:hypothetical protein
MSVDKLQISEILAAIDMNAKSVWTELSPEHQKQVSFWLLNRYVSAVKGNRDAQELAIFKTNEYYNKHWAVLGVKHAQLQWQLLCVCGNTNKIEYHPWIGFKKKVETNSAALKLLATVYPNMKSSDLELLAALSTKKELKKLAEDHGIENIKL